MQIKRQVSDARLRRARKTRARIRDKKQPRLCVHRTANHIYAQVLLPGDHFSSQKSDRVVVSASTLDKSVKQSVTYTGNCEAAAAVGRLIAERAKAAGLKKIAFDRSGFKYHGRVKALAESARESGLEF